jgi:hypothetical protein
MSLPKLDVPIFTTTLVSSGKKIQYRSFTVKEEKMFLMANEADDLEQSITTIKQVLTNCVVTPDFDVDNLPLFDIEYLFLRLRAVSVGEVVNLKYKCNNTIPATKEEEEKRCGAIVDIDLNLMEITPEADVDHDKKIVITENMGIVMKYPTMSLLDIDKTRTDIDSVIEIAIKCIDYIYDKDQIYYAKDSTSDELLEFVESLQTKDLEKIKLFFDTMPKMKKSLDFKCRKCGHEEKIHMEGIQSFFV